ncbi:MAG: FapA family protein [Candidatus Zixiibacteriota bacterium]
MAEAVATARKRVKVVVPRDFSSASITLFKPLAGESIPTIEEIISELEKAEVVYGIDKNEIARAITDRSWDVTIKAAQAVAPQKGKDASFEYCFETSAQHHPEQDADGRIDYRNLGFIQNVSEGDNLAKKIPATDGTPGIGVNGKEIAAVKGRDFPFKTGTNTKLSEDGLSLIATSSGAIVYKGGTVSVSDVVSIDKDVDFNTGNIETTGSVKIRGDVKTGFTVKAGGNIEIGGNVEDAKIIAEGNILVKGGFFGNGEGEIHAGNDITIKFAEGQRMTAGNDVIVGGELVNCKVTAKNKIAVKGQKGKILGGEVYAGKEVRVPVAGSDAGTATVLTVAFDASLIKELHKTTAEVHRLEADSLRVKESLYVLYKLQLSGKLPEAKVAALKQLEDFQKGVPAELEALLKRKTEILEKLAEYRDARIIIEERLYPGVVAQFGIVKREFTDELTCVKLLLDGNQVTVSEYKRDRD